ncbi:MAG: helix-turn-helix transcriptional regulator [Elusimicrobia bacterium]|nr:helix-turn-helix transcriptional regulator [Elusimicrobiota bacterium]
MAETFGTFLREALARRGMTLRAYALAIGLGKSHSFAYRVANGQAGPPMKDLARWAEPLGLNAKERKMFDLLAGVANSPEVVQAWFAHHTRATNAPAGDPNRT